MDTIIKLFEAYAGPVFALIFFGIIGYVFYWIIVIAPRRIKNLFTDLENEGYHSIESNDMELEETIAQIAAVYPVRPRKDQDTPPWNIRNAIKKKDWNGSLFIAHVTRLQIDQPGVKQNATSRATILFVEKRKLNIRGDIHITPKKNPGNNLWEKRYNAVLITGGYEQSFLDCYSVYASGSTHSPLPENLCRVLVEVCPHICRKELFCFQGGVNIRFTPEGWGISPANIIYKNPEFTMLHDVCFDSVGIGV